MRLKFFLGIPLILALSLLSTPIAAADDFDPFPYDINNDGIISKPEAVVAIADHFAGYITKAQALEVTALYYSGLDGK